MKQARYWLQFLLALVAVVLIAGHPGYSSIASTEGINTETTQDITNHEVVQAIDRRAASDRRIDSLLEQINRFCPAQLESGISRIIDTSTFSGSQWGILVEDLSTGTTLYSHNADSFLIPASNIKLLTTAAALQIYAADGQYQLGNVEQWINVINRQSDNDYADSLLSRIGGPSAVNTALLPLGISPLDYRQVDGSGLSRANLVKPAAFIALLESMRLANGSDVFYHSLPVAGMSGTLRDRFRNTAVEGKVHAKTGTLRGVKALSGYLEHSDYEMLAFSIVVNQPGQSGQVLTNAIDRIVLQLNQLQRCE